MLRVLQVYKTPFPEVRGGVDVVVSNLLKHPPPDCCCLLLRTAEWTQRGVAASRIDGVDVMALHLPVPPARLGDWKSWWFLVTRAPLALWRLHGLLRDQAIALVHLHTLQFYQMYFVLCRWLGGPPFIITLHRAEVLGFHTRHALMRACWRLVLRQAAAVNAVSAWLCAEATRRLPLAAPVHCITNGIAEADSPLPDGASLRQRLALPDDYFCMVGVLEDYKGHDLALEAWAKLSIDSALVVIGGGSTLARYRQLCDTLGITARVRLLGQLPHAETLALLRDSRAMIMPSRNEGLGLAILEAGMVGVPVIASDIAPFREMLAHEQNGLLFASEDVGQLVKAVQRLHDDEPLRTRLAQAFARHVRTHFSFDANARRYRELYQQALDGAAQENAR